MATHGKNQANNKGGVLRTTSGELSPVITQSNGVVRIKSLTEPYFKKATKKVTKNHK